MSAYICHYQTSEIASNCTYLVEDIPQMGTITYWSISFKNLKLWTKSFRGMTASGWEFLLVCSCLFIIFGKIYSSLLSMMPNSDSLDESNISHHQVPVNLSYCQTCHWTKWNWVYGEETITEYKYSSPKRSVPWFSQWFVFQTDHWQTQPPITKATHKILCSSIQHVFKYRF